MKPHRVVLSLLLMVPCLLAGAPAASQEAPPPAAPADVASVDAILEALYDVISGPVDEPRHWDRMRSLFLPGAQLIPTGRTPDGGHRARMMSVEDYIAQIGPSLERRGFREHEIARRTDRFGSIAQVFSTYVGTTAAEPDRPLRGINSIQLMHDGTRWWVVNVFWQAESEDVPIPAEYLPPGGRG